MIPAEALGEWTEIEARLRPYVARRVASGADVDDVLQEVFLKMQRGLSELRDVERFGSWMYRIAQHVIIDSVRAQARQSVVPNTELSEASTYEGIGDAHGALQSDLGDCVALFVARLRSPYREALTLTELEGLTQKDAGEMLGISVSGMKSRVQRGRKQVREMFDECCRISVDCRGRVVECEPRPLEEIPEDCRDAAMSWAARRSQ